MSRLAIDLSPALANLPPLSPKEKVLAAVPRTAVNRGTGLLALSSSLVRPRVVLDAGHGGKDPGAVGSVVEKQVTLDVALRVRALLQAAGVDVILTQRQMVEETGAYSRELHSSRSLGVLRENRIPSALVEIGFTSHLVDGLNLKDGNYLDRVALGIAWGIREALSGR